MLGQYVALGWLQSALRLPAGVLTPGVRLLSGGPVGALAQRAYWRIADPDALTAPGDPAAPPRVGAVQCARGPAAHPDSGAGATEKCSLRGARHYAGLT